MTVPELAAVVAAAWGGYLAAPSEARRRLVRLRSPPADPPALSSAGSASGSSSALSWAPWAPSLPLPYPLLSRLREAGAKRARVRARRFAAVELCDGLAAELRAGRTPAEALVRATGVLQPWLAAELEPVVAAARTGGDTAAALRRVGARPGAAGLSRLSACWRVGVNAGGSLAPAVERLADALRDEDAARQELDAQLAGARATARLLAGLPVIGVGLAFAMGANPFGFWFGGPVGYGSLAAGLGFNAAGALWMRRLTRKVGGAT